jgi:hypothetical protein
MQKSFGADFGGFRVILELPSLFRVSYFEGLNKHRFFAGKSPAHCD